MKRSLFFVLIGAFVVINALGLFNAIFTADSSLYANISKSFVTSGDYWNIYQQGSDWLDKPHFPFWLCALSMKLMGTNAFAYKLPSFLGFLLALLYTYKLANRLYNVNVARLAVVVLAASLHIIISNNDVRAEAILMGLIAAATYYTYMLSISKTIPLRYLFFAALFSATAIMTKGVFVLIVSYSAVLGNLLLKKEYNLLFSYRWILLIGLIFLGITPELYALYTQFDMHPEKQIFGTTHISGLRFFFWDSQFGRFSNTAPIKGSGDPFFYLHTMLWAFAPWAILGYTSLWLFTVNVIKKRPATEYVTYCGFLAMFFIFSASKFQLPHYLNILYPFLAIGVAETVLNRSKKSITNIINGSAYAQYALVFCMIFAINLLFKPEYAIISARLILIAMVVAFALVWKYATATSRGIYIMLISIGALGVYLNLNLYPSILKYQSGIAAANYINQSQPNREIVSTEQDWLLEFYSSKKVLTTRDIEKLRHLQLPVVAYVAPDMLSILDKAKIEYRVLKGFDHFHITTLTAEFIDWRKRKSVLQKRYVILLEKRAPTS